MNKGFSYIPYHSRRNSCIKASEALELLDKYCCNDPVEFLLQDLGKVNLEVGFGSGEFILREAIDNPDKLYLGCEVYNPGIVKLVNNLESKSIKNVLIYKGDARDILVKAPDVFFDNIYILFPDPWPKKKHHKRRLINPQFFEFIAKKFRSNLCIATDHEGYAESILYDIFQSGDYAIEKLEMTKGKCFSTKFETKAISSSSNVFKFILGARHE